MQILIGEPDSQHSITITPRPHDYRPGVRIDIESLGALPHSSGYTLYLDRTEALTMVAALQASIPFKEK